MGPSTCTPWLAGNPLELWNYCVPHIVVLLIGLASSFPSFVPVSSSSIGNLCSAQWLAETTHLSICQVLTDSLRRELYQAPVSKHFVASTIASGYGDCILDGSPGGDGLSFSLWSMNFFITTPKCVLFPLLKRFKESILWFSFKLSFIWSVNCILGFPHFWGNIHLSVSKSQVSHL